MGDLSMPSVHATTQQLARLAWQQAVGSRERQWIVPHSVFPAAGIHNFSMLYVSFPLASSLLFSCAISTAPISYRAMSLWQSICKMWNGLGPEGWKQNKVYLYLLLLALGLLLDFLFFNFIFMFPRPLCRPFAQLNIFSLAYLSTLWF